MKIALPSAFEAQMQKQLGTSYGDFAAALAQPTPTSIRRNPHKLPVAPTLPEVTWNKQGHYLPERPFFTGDPWLHGGAYYVQEASSMSIALPLQQHLNLSQPLRVLDLCGAPGGKATSLLSALSPESLLVTNEVVKARAQVLVENIVKWGYSNSVVTQNDPSHFQALPEFFDAIVVDAPCSGEGLFRRDAAAREEWSEEHVGLCSDRQRRILSDVWPALKPGGLLVYSTCTYNLEENENNLAWAQVELGAESLPITFPEGMDVTPSLQYGVEGYHFYPHQIQGEGFFLSVLRKPGSHSPSAAGKLKKPKLVLAKREDQGLLKDWLDERHTWDGFWQGDTLVGIPAPLLPALDQLARKLYILHAGTPMAERTKKKPNPTFQLGLSAAIRAEAFPLHELSYSEALSYLQKNDLLPEGVGTGWVRVGYQGQSLGWLKAMPNRANNYWPTPWRIRQAPKEEQKWSLAHFCSPST